MHVPFWGVLISGKKVFVFSGGANEARHVPKTGICVFRKQGCAISGGANEARNQSLSDPSSLSS